MTARLLAIAASGLLALAPAIAAENTGTPAGYVRSGKTTDCLRTTRIDSMKILNTEQILVNMKNGDAYLQEPSSCSPLRKSYSFVYTTVGGELCSTTGISLADASFDLSFAGICIFDKFQKLEKQSATAN